MRKIAATYLFTNNQPPIKNGILVCDDDGTIVDIIDNKGEFKETAGVEFYSGILVPGFVNTHCHLELSHLKGWIEEKTGIGDFIGKINQLRKSKEEDVLKAIRANDRKMWAEGIAAAGDISNSTLTIQTKQKSKIFYHTFVESFGFHPSRAEKSFAYATSVYSDFIENKCSASIVPHSPYSVSEALYNKIEQNARAQKSILSIHSQESKGEEEFFKTGTGPIAKHLQNNLGIDTSHWQPTGKNSLASVLRYLPKENQLLLVHNTYTRKKDLEELKSTRNPENTFFVLCPNSNLYIENQLPPLHLFKKQELQICLGTDSLASNHQLSILSEMLTLQDNFKGVHLEDLVLWSSLNGARALRISDTFGSFEAGKKPGVNLISGIDFKQMRLTQNSKVKRLI